MPSPQLSVLIPTPRRTPRRGLLLAGLAGASVLAAVAVLPWVWNVLALLQRLPHWNGLEQALAASPLSAWLLMLAWGAAVPLCLLAALRGGMHWRRSLLTVGTLVLAALWHMHMPALQQCSALYGPSALCGLLQALHPLSLGMTVAVYLFGLAVLLLSGLGLVVLPSAEEEDLDRYRYGV